MIARTAGVNASFDKRTRGWASAQFLPSAIVCIRPIANIQAGKVDPYATTITDERTIFDEKVLNASERQREIVDVLNPIIEALDWDPLVEPVREHLVRLDEHT